MPVRILIVDDEPELRGILSESLTARGHVTETVATGAAAITAVRTQPRPDVVLLDLNMPGALDGHRSHSSRPQSVAGRDRMPPAWRRRGPPRPGSQTHSRIR
jgi:CheY-like chemotaxis protein